MSAYAKCDLCIRDFHAPTVAEAERLITNHYGTAHIAQCAYLAYAKYCENDTEPGEEYCRQHLGSRK